MGWILGLILTLSLFVRGWGATSVPPELFGDELDVGYQAYSLYLTGRDLYNQALPTFIHSLAEWRAPLLMYATVPSIAALGLTEIGVRLPQVLFGSLAPILLFLLAHRTFKSKSLSLLVSLSLALTPWHIHYSRAAFEVVIMLDLILLGTLLFIRHNFALSTLLFALAMYTYSTAVLFVPLWLITLTLLNKRRPSIASLLLLLLALSPLIYHIVAGPARDRFGLLSIFSGTETIGQINLARQAEGPTSILWHNKGESYFTRLYGNYLRAFSTEFLFVRGDPNHRHSVQFIGQLLPITAPLLILGLYDLARKRRWLWLVWLALAPLPSILTVDGGYHATRLFLMIPPLAVAIGVGLHAVIKWHPRLMAPGLAVVFAIYFAWVSHQYLVHYPVDSWRWWHVGFKSALTELDSLAPQYSRVFLNNTYEPSLIRFLFYTRYSPAKFHKEFALDQPKAEIMPGYDGFTLDGKFFFGAFSDSARQNGIADNLLPNSLYLISQRDDVGGDWDWRSSPPDRVQVLHTSLNPQNEPLFYLVTSKP